MRRKLKREIGVGWRIKALPVNFTATFQKWTPQLGQCPKWNLPWFHGCHFRGSLVEVHRIRGAPVQCAVTALGVVETEVAGQTCPKLGGALERRLESPI